MMVSQLAIEISNVLYVFVGYRKWSIKRRGAYIIFPVIGAVLTRERRLFESGAYFNYG